MRIDTNMLSGVTDKDTIMKVLLEGRSHTHTWMHLNGNYKVLIVRVDMRETMEQNFVIEVWRINSENPAVGFQFFDRHVGMPNDELRLEPVSAWMYPSRAAMITDLTHFIDANVHNS